MSVIDTGAFIIPSNPEVIKQIKDACFEVSNSLTRIESEKDLIKGALEVLAEDTEIPKKALNKLVKLYHKQNKDAVEAEQENTNTLYDAIFTERTAQESQ